MTDNSSILRFCAVQKIVVQSSLDRVMVNVSCPGTALLRADAKGSETAISSRTFTESSVSLLGLSQSQIETAHAAAAAQVRLRAREFCAFVRRQGSVSCLVNIREQL